MAARNSIEFELRRCGAGDELALSLLAQATVLETYAGITEGSDLYAYVTDKLRPEALRELIARESTRAWIAETNPGQCAVGYALVFPVETAGELPALELDRLYIFYRFHGRGIGKRLLDMAIAYARASGFSAITLRVAADNAQAIAFYERSGFATISEDAFRAGSTDYRVFVMRLTL